jgi:hypothetical protein
MAELRLDAIAILFILLPGFLSARIEQRLTVTRDQTELDKVVDALLYSLATYLIFAAIIHPFPVRLTVQSLPDGSHYYIETNPGRLAVLPLIAIVLAVGMSFAANNDLFGRLFRWMRVSKRSWRDTIWSDVFHNFEEAVQVELADGRSLVGWLKYYSDRPDEASLFLERAYWVGPEQQLIEINGPGIFLTRDCGIRSISFLNWSPDPHAPDSRTFTKGI